jgi:UDP-N-acetylmuramoyl-L-alanyl-D-glutamate--2,6-diaminopimelate ligase
MKIIFTRIKEAIKNATPIFVLSIYHFLWSILGAIIYGMPSRKIIVIGVTGTKGKSSVIEMANAIFEEAGYKTALASTIRIKVATKSRQNLRKMTMPGRLFVQRFLRDAVYEKCDVAFIEMTSEGVKQHRHRFLQLDALVFTNLQKEHIESHGSFEKYAAAKLSIGKRLAKSRKRPRIIIANSDDERGGDFLSLPVENQIPFSLSMSEPYNISSEKISFRFDDTTLEVPLPGRFNLYNALAASVLARAFGIKTPTIVRALAKMKMIPGRAQEINEGQNFKVIIDYAHTPDSLKAIYDAYGDSRKICVLGSTGGGRDTWKRPTMGGIAEDNCSHIILTDEDPYDESPQKIIEEMVSGMRGNPEIIMDRGKAIEHALSLAGPRDVVLITGKGTDPFIMGREGSKQEWSDEKVARTALKSLVDARKSAL